MRVRRGPGGGVSVGGMSDVALGVSARPRRVAYAAVVAVVAYGVFGLVTAVTGRAIFYRAADAGPVWLNWIVVVVAAFATTAALAVVWRWRIPRAVVLTALVGCCVALGMAAFGLVMELIVLAVGEAPDSWTATVNQALAAAAVVLLARTTGLYRSAGVTVVRRVEEPTSAPRSVRITAYLGAAAFLPYATMKTIWALGGTFAGSSGAEMVAISRRNGASGIWLTLESWGLDVTALLAVLGVFLLFGLVRPWGQVFPRWTLWLRGRRVPRWLPLIPALLGAATLAPYGVLGVGYAALGSAGLVHVSRGDFHTPGDALLVTWFGLSAFASYGVALTVATWSYLRRTQSRAA